jgi:hypothetical protein
MESMKEKTRWAENILRLKSAKDNVICNDFLPITDIIIITRYGNDKILIDTENADKKEVLESIILSARGILTLMEDDEDFDESETEGRRIF